MHGATLRSALVGKLRVPLDLHEDERQRLMEIEPERLKLGCLLSNSLHIHVQNFLLNQHLPPPG